MQHLGGDAIVGIDADADMAAQKTGTEIDAATAQNDSESLRIEQLVESHYAEIYRYAFRLAGNSADASDLTQQTFLNAHKNLLALREAAKARGWLYAILRNTFLKLRRKRSPLSAGNLELEVDSLPDPVLTVSQKSIDLDPEELQSALLDLPDEFRAVILMFYFEELSYRQIASELKIPEGTVMSRLSRAKGHLRKRLSRAL